jgi:LacI family transcriptional regulator
MDLKQLSRVLDLSPTTVSRALNGYAEVSEATRLRVMAAATEHGYKPNFAARRLALQKSETVGIIYPPDVGELADPRFLEVVAGMTERFSEYGIDLLLVTTRQKDELATYARMVQGRRVDALIVARTRVDDARVDYLLETGFPFVAYGRTSRCAEHAWFDFDNAEGTSLAVQRLVTFGHRNIAYVQAPQQLNFAFQRLAGYRQGLARAGLAERTEWIVPSGMTRRGGYEAMCQLLALPEPPTAVVVDNNLAGIGAVRAALDSGITLGRQLSVIVYDGVPEDNLLRSPAITSIDQPTPHRAGEMLAGLMQQAQQNQPLNALQVLWHPSITAGTSDGPAPP